MMKSTKVVCRLHCLRKAAHVTQGELVDRINDACIDDIFPFIALDRISLSKAENGSIILIPDHVHAIAAFLGCTAHDIYPNLYPENAAD